ncbi:GvpL/GvpF family gas vesicle protein [Dactylosporangium sucinum]|uniref:Gas vesicle protein n=1 Tax=Dactylosporangium sucinum TaxID=1424081 RepID=A0A917WY68_9ACTN|nr:GvpL/GvpF family gas vesicle protein [Dactylosporangium sucinum]GGM44517.1 gas vesicle protein [Dactylosporangium sucinum]
MGEGLWLHAVTRAGPPPGGLTGVDGAPVRVVETAGLAAAVSPVDLDRFGEEALQRNLEDLTWLEGVARSHHAVVAALGASRTVVPARLATVYADAAGVRTMLADRHADLDAALSRLDGRTELGVKIYATPAPEPAAAPAGGSGTDYLRRRRAQLSAVDDRRQRAVDGAEEVHAALAGRAEAARRHPPQDRRLTGRPEPMVLNAAYLVDEGHADGFAAAVAAQAAGHADLDVELTGPWPPYSFTAPDADGDAAAEGARS